MGMEVFGNRHRNFYGMRVADMSVGAYDDRAGRSTLRHTSHQEIVGTDEHRAFNLSVITFRSAKTGVAVNPATSARPVSSLISQSIGVIVEGSALPMVRDRRRIDLPAPVAFSGLTLACSVNSRRRSASFKAPALAQIAEGPTGLFPAQPRHIPRCNSARGRFAVSNQMK
jgi:hypothetical protein